MEISGQVDEEAFVETRRLLWAPHFRLNLINNFVFHRFGFLRLMLIVSLVMFGSSFLASKAHISDRALVPIGACAVCATVAIIALRSEKPTEKILAKVNGDVPLLIRLEEQGLTTVMRDGTVAVIPWPNFERCQAGDSVTLLYLRRHSFPYVLPLAACSRDERKEIEASLRRVLSSGSDATQ